MHLQPAVELGDRAQNRKKDTTTRSKILWHQQEGRTQQFQQSSSWQWIQTCAEVNRSNRVTGRNRLLKHSEESIMMLRNALIKTKGISLSQFSHLARLTNKSYVKCSTHTESCHLIHHQFKMEAAAIRSAVWKFRLNSNLRQFPLANLGQAHRKYCWSTNKLKSVNSRRILAWKKAKITLTTTQSSTRK